MKVCIILENNESFEDGLRIAHTIRIKDEKIDVYLNGKLLKWENYWNSGE